jgi:hypothetical protein
LEKEKNDLNIELNKYKEYLNSLNLPFNQFQLIPQNSLQQPNQNLFMNNVPNNNINNINNNNDIKNNNNNNINNNNNNINNINNNNMNNNNKINNNNNNMNNPTMNIINDYFNNNNNNNLDSFPGNNSRANETNKKIYSYESLNTSQLSTEIYQGAKEAKIDIILKNKGNEIWPMNNTKLIIDKSSSTLTLDDIVLEPQKPGEQKNYCAIFKGISGISPGEYKSYLSFCVNNEIIGEKLVLTVKIKKKDKTMIEIEENIDKINEFRKSFDISEETYSNERLLRALKKYKFNYDSAFGSLFIES